MLNLVPIVETLAQHADPAPSSSRTAFLERFFAELGRRQIAYVVLHSYEQLHWHARASDIDYAVAKSEFRKIPGVLAMVARQTGWVLTQSFSHRVFGRYAVLVDPENPTDYLKLDACSHYAPTPWLFVRDEILLAGRRRYQGHFVPAPGSEFIYLLAKVISNSNATYKYLGRLSQLAVVDPLGVQERFRAVFRNMPAGERFVDPAQLAELRVLARRRGGSELVVADLRRRVERVLRPPGFQIAVLGPDDVGKSTLLHNLGQTLGPCFTRRRIYKFRPDVFNTIKPETQPRPHARAPRGRILSWAKMFYYAADRWLGFLVRLLPEKSRGALLLFDLDFNDVVVDRRRYLVRGVRNLARVLRRALPQADATFILSADPEAVHTLKPELPVTELERQLTAYRSLASRHSRMHVVCADQPADEVVRLVSRTVILQLAQREQHRRLSLAKRVFDVFVAAAALVILAPVLAALALAVRLAVGPSILFKQQRPGLCGRPFTIYKFRTMSNARNAAGHFLPDAERLGWFGKFLRSTSLDELPELINVLRGEMSIVGPRPLMMEYLPRYSAEQMRRHDLLPGITGLAQINGRNAASWPRKFELDVWYVDHRSMWLDLKIIATTVWKVLKRDGINQSDRVSSEPFMGNADIARSRNGVHVKLDSQVMGTGAASMNNGVRVTNVLFTCAGRRTFIIRAFQQALNNCGRVFACDASPDAPALQMADKGFVVPSVEADNYLDVLLTICRERRVRLLVPAVEPELPLLAAHRARFLKIGTLPLVSSPEIVAICYDKLETARFLNRCGLAVPRTYVQLEAAREALSRGEITFPLVVKPRWGVSSIGLAISKDDQELDFAFKTTEKQIACSFFAQVSAAAPKECVLIQERLSGEEYGLDIVNDLNGRHVCTFAKRKLKMRAGQTDRAITVNDEKLEKLGRLIGEQLGHVGILDCDLFASEEGYRVIDLNPRIGGGYPFSHVAGANVPAALIAWMNGEEADPRCFQIQPNLAIARCDEYVAIDPRTAFPTAQRCAQTHVSTQNN